MSELTAIKIFFGTDGSLGSLRAFADEVRALRADETRELAALAREEMIRRGTHTPFDFAF